MFSKLADIEILLVYSLKEKIDVFFLHIHHSGMLPFWTLIFINKKCPYTFKEFSMVYKALRNFELHLEYFFQLHIFTPFNLFKNYCHTQWAQWCYLLLNFCTKLRLTTKESGIDVLNRIILEYLIDLFQICNWFTTSR